MTTRQLSPKLRRLALETLPRDRLKDVTDALDLDVGDRRLIANHVNALIRSRRVDFADVLALLKRDELKTMCEALGLDTKGKAKQVFVDRILGLGKPMDVKPTKPAPEPPRIHEGQALLFDSVAKPSPPAPPAEEEKTREEPPAVTESRPAVAESRPPAVDLARLMKLRLVVARHGEMDLARWWNSKGMLGRLGAIALERGFPRTHYFAQARVVFAVARSRCAELFQPPGCMTLWHLPAELEDQFEERWHDWLDEGETWKPFFEEIAKLDGRDLLANLNRFELLSPQQAEAATRLRRSAEGRAVPLPGVHQPDDDVLTLLAAGFCRGEPGQPAIPYARLED